MKHGKKYVESRKLIDSSTLYDITEAIELCTKTGKAKFDETVEVHVRLGVDSRHADQQVRGAVVLPNGTGKKVRVLVFAKNDAAKAAEAAGAEYVGGEEYMQKIMSENWMDFDVVIATPDMMGIVGRLGKILGPRGELRYPDGRYHQGEACRLQGPVYPLLHRGYHHGPWREDQPRPVCGYRRPGEIIKAKSSASAVKAGALFVCLGGTASGRRFICI